MEDLKNSYLNEQGLRQERDALRIENARLRALLRAIRANVWSGLCARIDAALEMSGGVK